MAGLLIALLTFGFAFIAITTLHLVPVRTGEGFLHLLSITGAVSTLLGVSSVLLRHDNPEYFEPYQGPAMILVGGFLALIAILGNAFIVSLSK